MRICGVQGVSAIDFPGRIAAVLFLGGCNFRCPFCQNPGLVLRPESLPAYPIEATLRMIARRKGLVDGVVVTGGEPLLHGKELFVLLRRVRDAGMAVKLDTNGYENDILRAVLSQRLVDYVAMDVKTSLSSYAGAVGRALDVKRIRDAIDALEDSGIEHEYRTTCVPGLVRESDVESIAALLGGGARYVLQQFRSAPDLIDPAYAEVPSYSSAELQSFAGIARPFVGSVALRGL